MSATIAEIAETIEQQIETLKTERAELKGTARAAITRQINRLEKQRAETARSELTVARARAALKDLTAEEAEPAIDSMNDDEVAAELARQTEEAADEAREDVAAAGINPDAMPGADTPAPLPKQSLDALVMVGEKVDELDAEQRQRAIDAPKKKAGLRGKALGAWIIGGKAGVEAQAANGRARHAAAKKTTAAKSKTRKGAVGAKDEDIAAATLGSETAAEKDKPLSQRVTPREANIARAAMAALIAERVSAGHFPNAPADAETAPGMFPAALGFKSERAFRAYVNGTDKTLKDEARAGVKDLTKRINSHQVWARKAAAAAFGVMRQLQA